MVSGMLALVGAVAIAGVGTFVWNGGALRGLRGVGYEMPLGMAALGFLIGTGAFFAPCAFVMFPAYVSYYVSLGGGGLRQAITLGLACAAGAIAFFATLGAVLATIGGGVAPYLIAAKPIVATLIVALGVVQLLDVRLPPIPQLRLSSGRHRSAAVSVFGYGFGYGLASTGCTLPLYVSITSFR